MTCPKCQCEAFVSAGFTNAKTPRFRCKLCETRFVAPKVQPIWRHRTSTDDAARVFTLLVEGMSMRSVERVTGITKQTIAAMILSFGAKCATLFDTQVRHLKSERIQCDEIYGFCYARRPTVNRNPDILDKHPDAGDVWLWTAIDADTKLIASFNVGDRDVAACDQFISDLAYRLDNRQSVQITTDALTKYRDRMATYFHSADYTMLQKVYKTPEDVRYSSKEVVAVIPKVISGDPDPAHISTSYVERHNLTMRMSLRRFTRLTNGFTKKRIYLDAMVAIFMTYYNFCRVHHTLKTTPAVAAGLATTAWSIADLLTWQEPAEMAA